MKTYKIFISQPMVNKTEEEIKFDKLIASEVISKIMGSTPYEIVDSFFTEEDVKNWKFEKVKPLHYISKSIEVLADCDYIYFVNGYKASNGCKIEYMCAKQYGIDFLQHGINIVS